MTNPVSLKGGKTHNNDEIDDVETELGLRFPDDYRRFLLGQDGARPESNIFTVSEALESGVNQFIPMNEIRKERDYLDNLAPVEIPIAWAEGGNYVCLNMSGKGSIFFWDHEEPDTKHRLADNFAEFFEMLSPFDPEEVTLKPGQVKKAWIDPDFLKSLDQD